VTTVVVGAALVVVAGDDVVVESAVDGADVGSVAGVVSLVSSLQATANVAVARRASGAMRRRA
jgi:hypothetical protein